MKQCDAGHFYDEKRHETCPYCQPGQVAGATVALAPPGATVPLQPADEGGRTVAMIRAEVGIDPPVGFAVAIAGPHRGADFRIRDGRNFVGRTSTMAVSLPDDSSVSRENHCVITYDHRSNLFSISPGSGRGNTYLNGTIVDATTPLEAFDRIEVGHSTLVFVPFCGDQFRWEDAAAADASQLKQGP